jgi:hypothetical protein
MATQYEQAADRLLHIGWCLDVLPREPGDPKPRELERAIAHPVALEGGPALVVRPAVKLDDERVSSQQASTSKPAIQTFVAGSGKPARRRRLKKRRSSSERRIRSEGR